MIQWLGLHAPSAWGTGSIPEQETRSHVLQLGPGAAKINNFFFKKKTQQSGLTG